MTTSHLIISRRKNYAENDYKEIIEEKKRYTLEKYIKVSTGILKKLKSISYKENNIWGWTEIERNCKYFLQRYTWVNIYILYYNNSKHRHPILK